MNVVGDIFFIEAFFHLPIILPRTQLTEKDQLVYKFRPCHWSSAFNLELSLFDKKKLGHPFTAENYEVQTVCSRIFVTVKRKVRLIVEKSNKC